MDIGEIIAKEEIRALMARYNHAGDAGQAEEVANTFTSDAELETIEGKLTGLEEIRKFYEQRRAIREEDARRNRSAKHYLSTQQIVVRSEAEAEATTYFLFVRLGQVEQMGTYFDQFVKPDSQWLIKHRNVVMNWLESAND